MDDPNGPDDRDQANYVAHIASDRRYVTDTEFTYKGGFGTSRYKKITKDWQPFSFMAGNVALDKDLLEANPPPFSLAP